MKSSDQSEYTKRSTGKSEAVGATATWQSFWDITDPESVSTVMTELYGAAAARAASNCADAAQADGRMEDYRFWLTAWSCINATHMRRRKEAVERWNASGLCHI